jgi:hypothetical protein
MTVDETSELRDLIVVSEPSGRQLIAPMPWPIVDNEGLVVLNEALMFAEQKQMDPQGGMQVQIMMMPLLFTEFITQVVVIPASWFIIPAQSTVAIEYRQRWDEYATAARAASAGIVTARSIPKGPVLVAPNGRP